MIKPLNSAISGFLGSVTILQTANNLISLAVAVVALLPTYWAWKERIQKTKNQNKNSN